MPLWQQPFAIDDAVVVAANVAVVAVANVVLTNGWNSDCSEINVVAAAVADDDDAVVVVAAAAMRIYAPAADLRQQLYWAIHDPWLLMLQRMLRLTRYCRWCCGCC